MTALERLDAMEPFDEAAALGVVRALLDELGDVPPAAMHQLLIVQDEPDRFVRAAMRTRAAHFRARGLRVPSVPRSAHVE